MAPYARTTRYEEAFSPEGKKRHHYYSTRHARMFLHFKKNVLMVTAVVFIRDTRLAVIYPSHVYEVCYTSDELTKMSLEEILKASTA